MPHLKCTTHERRVVVVNDDVVFHRNGDGSRCPDDILSHRQMPLDRREVQRWAKKMAPRENPAKKLLRVLFSAPIMDKIAAAEKAMREFSKTVTLPKPLFVQLDPESPYPARFEVPEEDNS